MPRTANKFSVENPPALGSWVSVVDTRKGIRSIKQANMLALVTSVSTEGEGKVAVLSPNPLVLLHSFKGTPGKRIADVPFSRLRAAHASEHIEKALFAAIEDMFRSKAAASGSVGQADGESDTSGAWEKDSTMPANPEAVSGVESHVAPDQPQTTTPPPEVKADGEGKGASTAGALMQVAPQTGSFATSSHTVGEQARSEPMPHSAEQAMSAQAIDKHAPKEASSKQTQAAARVQETRSRSRTPPQRSSSRKTKPMLERQDTAEKDSRPPTVLAQGQDRKPFAFDKLSRRVADRLPKVIQL